MTGVFKHDEPLERIFTGTIRAGFREDPERGADSCSVWHLS
jgi:hypothetical protein